MARLLSLCCADPAKVSPDVVAQHVEVARRRAEFSDAERDVSTALRSVVRTASYGTGHAYRRAVDSVGHPVLLLHGRQDRLVPVAAARAAARGHPGWTLVELPGVGHVPQLEAPEECARVITSWLGADGRPALTAAGRSHPGRGWPAGGPGGRPGGWPAWRGSAANAPTGFEVRVSQGMTSVAQTRPLAQRGDSRAGAALMEGTGR